MNGIQWGYYTYPAVRGVTARRLAAIRTVLPMRCRLIDLGCNDATISNSLFASGQAISCLGIDFEDTRAERHPDFEFIEADLRGFDLDALPRADAILCLNVLHHLCLQGPDFARNFLASLSTKAGVVLCDMGSLTEKGTWPWLQNLRANWPTDQHLWADLFAPFAWRRPLLTYPMQGGRRVLWKLTTALEPPCEFEVLETYRRTAAMPGTIKQLVPVNDCQSPSEPDGESGKLYPDLLFRKVRRRGTEELFWAKAYQGRRALADSWDAEHHIHAGLKSSPFNCDLPMVCHPQYGDIYGYDPELAALPGIHFSEAHKLMTPQECSELVRFGSQKTPAPGNCPLHMACDFQCVRTSRGLTFRDFEPLARRRR